MNSIFFVVLLLFSGFVFPAAQELSDVSKDRGRNDEQGKKVSLLAQLFVLTGKKTDCHFYDAQFLNATKTRALCILGLACESDVRGYIKEHLLNEIKKVKWPRAYHEMRGVIGETTNTVLANYKKSIVGVRPEDVKLCSILIRMVYLDQKSMMSFWVSRPDVETCTQLIIPEKRSYQFDSLHYHQDDPKFRSLDARLVEAYAEKDAIEAFIEHIWSKNPGHCVGVATNYKRWQTHLNNRSGCVLQ